MKKCRALLQRFAAPSIDHILFSDEKIFNVESKWNSQNNRVIGTSVQDLPPGANRMQRTLHPPSVMVWAGVSSMGKTGLVFVDQGVKVRKENYISDILIPRVLPLSQTMFPGMEWHFQQDSAPAHAAKLTQQWCRSNLPSFIAKEDWPSSSPDLNVMDYFVWSRLEQMVNNKNFANLSSLKRNLTAAWNQLPMEEIRKAVHSWRNRLQACVKAKGGFF